MASIDREYLATVERHVGSPSLALVPRRGRVFGQRSLCIARAAARALQSQKNPEDQERNENDTSPGGVKVCSASLRCGRSGGAAWHRGAIWSTSGVRQPRPALASRSLWVVEPECIASHGLPVRRGASRPADGVPASTVTRSVRRRVRLLRNKPFHSCTGRHLIPRAFR